MIETNITDDQLVWATNLYDFQNLNGSITKGKSNIYGAIGEVVFHDFCVKMGYEVKMENTYHYDLIVNGYKVDVKTKKTTVVPRADYNCSISSFNISQRCSYYVFIRVMVDKSKAFILGGIKKNEFYKKASFHREGEPDPNRPNWKFKGNCYNLPINELQPIKIR